MSGDFEQAKSRVCQSEGAYVSVRPLASSWEQRKLEDVATIVGGGTPSTNNDAYWDGDIDWYSPAELGEQMYADRSVRRITQAGYDSCSATLLPAGKTILFTSRAGIGNAAILRRSACTNQGFQSLVVNDDTDVYFVYSMTDRIKKFAEQKASGSTFLEISGKGLAAGEFAFPSKGEQTAIGSMFKQLDHLITLHQRKYDKLCTVKKSMLDKMFPKPGETEPEIRFEGFTDPWEQRKLGEIFEEYSEKNRADLPSLTIIQGGGTVYRDESNRNLQFDKNSLSNYKAVNPDDFIVHLRSFEGGLEKATYCGLISPAYHTFHGDGIDSDFYYLYFRSKRFIDTDLKPHVYGIRDGRSIDIDGMKTIPIPWTTVNEQRAIGGFYNSLDSFITLHQRKLELLRNIKKSLLDRMFV